MSLVAPSIIKKKESEWNIINTDGTTVNDEEEVAELFNDFFIEKVEQLKKNIDKDLVEYPLCRPPLNRIYVV